MITNKAIGEKGWRNRSDASVVDNGRSAFHEENFGPKAQLMLFLAAAKEGKNIRKGFTVLVFAHETRFTRAKIHKGNTILKELTDNGVYVYFANSDTFLLPGWENDAKIEKELTTAFDTARKEIELRQEYINFSNLKKISDLQADLVINTGKYPWFVKFVEAANKCSSKYDKSDELVFPDTDNPLTWWDIAVRIKLEFLSGKIPLEIADGLNHDNIPCPKGGNNWRAGQLRRLLRTKLFLGIATLGGTTTINRKRKIKGTKEFKIYPAVASDEEWNRIQHRFSKATERTGPNALSGGVNSLFPRLATCAACGGALMVRTRASVAKDGKEHFEHPLYRMYSCRNHCETGTCKVKVALPVAILEEDFCGNYLQQDLVGLLRKEDAEQTNLVRELEEKVSARKLEVKDYKALLEAAENATAKKAVLELLNAAGNRLEAAQLELDRVPRRLIDSPAPAALNDIQAGLRGIDADPLNPEAWRKVELPMEGLKAQLADLNIRRRVTERISDLIAGLVVDLERQSYKIKHLQCDVVAERDLSAKITAVKKELAAAHAKLLWVVRRRNGTDGRHQRKGALKNGLKFAPRVLKALAELRESVGIDKLIKLCHMDRPNLHAALEELTAQGKVLLDGQGYRLKRPGET
jgi:hypothetical protein